MELLGDLVLALERALGADELGARDSQLGGERLDDALQLVRLLSGRIERPPLPPPPPPRPPAPPRAPAPPPLDVVALGPDTPERRLEGLAVERLPAAIAARLGGRVVHRDRLAAQVFGDLQ